MGLYLTIFRGDAELDGVEVGSYADFGAFRDSVTDHLEAGVAGSKFPTLILHSDCDGEWSPAECRRLLKELSVIEQAFRALPPAANETTSLKEARSKGARPQNLSDCFLDVDGEPLTVRLSGLARLSIEQNLPILFQ